eukprot:TRINITY_DN67468_c8_g5_i1.p1 TRINITY_DN67468_c8_g5~~TRINITY_DN67468_c8_g5_i1.p1  ORF type:complete len:389 (-),score=192.20 TRINITY_DN67468_c8_g5_i1:140-1306(-)
MTATLVGNKHVQRFVALLDEADLALQLVCMLTPPVVNKPQLAQVLGEERASQFRRHVDDEDEYRVAARRVFDVDDADSEAGARKLEAERELARQAARRVRESFNAILGYVRLHPEVVGALQKACGVDAGVVGQDWFRVVDSLGEYLTLMHGRLEEIRSTGQAVDLERRVQDLVSLEHELKERHAELSALLSAQTKDRNAQRNEGQNVIKYLRSTIAREQERAQKQADDVAKRSTDEMERLKQDHARTMQALRKRLELLNTRIGTLSQEHDTMEKEMKRTFKGLDRQLKAKIESYDELMIDVTTKIERVTELHEAESTKLVEVREKVQGLQQDRVTYEETVLKPRQQRRQQREQQHAAAMIIQTTFKNWNANRKKAIAAAKKAAKKKAK